MRKSRTSSRPQKFLAGEPIDPDRSALMACVRDKHSKPEMVVRRIAHGLGFRFRLHRRDLPGTPDLVFPSMRKVIFVHGCFWHRHKGCVRTTSPATRRQYWADKFAANIKRDRAKQRKLRTCGWEVLVIWECQTFDIDDLTRRLTKFFDQTV
jgi:DNA mismatch endonuclease (patch repair protein)